MTPQAFIAKWEPGGPAYNLNEEQGAKSHLMELCDLLGVPRPGSESGYLFEQGGRIAGQASGCADVYNRGAFAWENKAPCKNLDAALRQLLGFTLALDNPPLLVVCDRLTIRIQTQFNGHPSERHEVAQADLEQHDKRELLKRVWTAPESFKSRTTNRDITEAAARLNALRENWLNPPEWTERVPEVTPLGIERSPCPDRIVPKAGLSEADAKALQKRTLTNLYNKRPAWLAMAHEALDAAVAAAYG